MNHNIYIKKIFIMRKILSILFIILSFGLLAQGVAINTDGSNPNSSSILDVKSNSKGILIPRMTETQKNAISSPATGLMIYQTDGTSGFWYFNGSSWIQSIGTTGAQGIQGATGATGATGPAPSGTGIVTVNSGVLGTPTQLSGDITTSGSNLVTTIGASKVTSSMITNGTIVNADINASAAIAPGKIEGGSDGQFLTTNSLLVPTWSTLTQSGTTVNQTATITPTNITMATITGLTTTFTADDNHLYFVSTHGCIVDAASTTNRNVNSQIAIFVDGVILNGATQVVTAQNFASTSRWGYGPWSINLVVSLSAGSHTIDVRGNRRNESLTDNPTIGGAAADKCQGSLTVLKLTK